MPPPPSNELGFAEFNGPATACALSALAQRQEMNCRPGCGACCIAPSISSLGKPAGQACSHLSAEFRCAIFGSPHRPACCTGLLPSDEMCGSDRDAALAWLTRLESATAPPGID